jgi:hypothetical protein
MGVFAKGAGKKAFLFLDLGQLFVVIGKLPA